MPQTLFNRTALSLAVIVMVGAAALLMLAPGITSLALWLLGLAQLATMRGTRPLACLLASGAFALLAPGMLSYLLPEAWLPTAAWQLLAERVLPGATLETLRAPLLTSIALQLTALALLLDLRARLGAPLLVIAAALLLGLQSIGSTLYSGFTPLLHYAATWPSLLLHATLLLAQAVYASPYWYGKRYLATSLWSTLGLVGVTLLLWQQLHLQAERTLYQRAEARVQTVTSQLSREITAHLDAMRRFARTWELQSAPPSYRQWVHQAEGYQRDFGYLINMAFITPDSGIRQVYPATPVNLSTLGLRLFDVQPAGRPALEPALRGEREGSTDIIELLQGEAGMIHYLPVNNEQQTPIGAAAMVVSFSQLADTLFERLTDTEGLIQWRDGEQILAEHGDASHPGPWAYQHRVALGDKTLTLSDQPRRQYLLSQLPRLPTLSLVLGLTFAYLVYLVIYTFKRLGHHHRAIQESNQSLQQEIKTRSKLQREVEWLARHDELTGIANRRHFLDHVNEHQNQRPLSLALFDIDHFKRVNDQLGHLVGDDYLARMAVLGEALIGHYGGIFARYGGEEFVAWLPGLDLDTAYKVADTLRLQLVGAHLAHANGEPITLSAGVVSVNDPQPLNMTLMMQTADEALYRAKREGRNRVATGRAAD
ncbi:MULTISPECIES: sensor domain-containing diguanylate cyclase [unclassified Halomonas]|uniref:sensor domain-containing diguanylate cyclase n=1 Tax=unclassified Halomonas TaxID=2609666 RepID=UPI0006DA49AE|nr:MULTISPECIES: sensor domain-containing diguanylate cyclase [unclassified Halomonas]KPQ20209.1 MAG: diguanylate cyclase with CHASE domain [Halomonas sp. HL-93]SBR46364.1 diguanylate cyclase (GGDEF) domain-containing protein [Halomonas sp. HL-93]SNY98720.1 diguanylate cyclase (GGDEF) domain-containing protein [Halomonas sp. hl-4]